VDVIRQALLRWYHAELIAWFQLPAVWREAKRIRQNDHDEGRAARLAHDQIPRMIRHISR